MISVSIGSVSAIDMENETITIAESDTIDILQNYNENTQFNESDEPVIGASQSNVLSAAGDYQKIKDHDSQINSTVTGYTVGSTITIDWYQAISYGNTGYLYIDGSNTGTTAYGSYSGYWVDSAFSYTFTEARKYTFQVFTDSGSTGYASNILTYDVLANAKSTLSLKLDKQIFKTSENVVITPTVLDIDNNTVLTGNVVYKNSDTGDTIDTIAITLPLSKTFAEGWYNITAQYLGMIIILQVKRLIFLLL